MPKNPRALLLLIFCLVIETVAIRVCLADEQQCWHYSSDGTTLICDVSIIELIAAPCRYAGKRVRVIGYVSLEFEGTAIYLHEHDYKHRISKNAIWLDVKPERRMKEKLGYAIVEGTFAGDKKGHMGFFSGSLIDVSRMDPWKLGITNDGSGQKTAK